MSNLRSGGQQQVGSFSFVSQAGMNSTGDDWFIEHFMAIQSRLYRYIATLVPSRTDAEDLLQKTALSAWRERERFERGREFFPWVCGVARNHVRHHYRSAKRSRVTIDADVAEQLAIVLAERDSETEQMQEALDTCLEKLPQDQRQLLRRFYEGSSVPVLAQDLGRSVEALYKTLQRSRAALSACVGGILAAEGQP
jgi:RNA polymerase sigma-70 factor (ECF subfamily)